MGVCKVLIPNIKKPMKYTLKVFAEQVSKGNWVDYASNMVDVGNSNITGISSVQIDRLQAPVAGT